MTLAKAEGIGDELWVQQDNPDLFSLTSDGDNTYANGQGTHYIDLTGSEIEALYKYYIEAKMHNLLTKE